MVYPGGCCAQCAVISLVNRATTKRKPDPNMAGENNVMAAAAAAVVIMTRAAGWIRIRVFLETKDFFTWNFDIKVIS